MDRQIRTLRDRAVRQLRSTLDGPEDDRTAGYRRVAEAFVDLRAVFYTDSGDPDWRGSTYPYRQAIGEVWSLASVPKDDLHTVSAAIRYHVGNVLRERLDDETLEAIGLRAESPRARSVEKRERQSVLLQAMRPGPGLGEGLDILRSLTAAHALLGRVPSGAFRDLEDPTQRKAARTLLNDLQTDLDRLQKDSRRRR